MKIICEVVPNISIWADEHQYIVRVKKNSGQKDKHAECWYYSSLDYCFQEVFDYLCRERLVEGGSKTLEVVAGIVKDIAKEIKAILKPFVDLGYENKQRHSTAGAGKAGLNSLVDTLEGKQ
jgi:hypothetical protein